MDIEVIIIAPRYSKIQEYEHPSIKVFRIMSIPAGYYDDFRWTVPHSPTVLKIFHREKVDLVHFMTPIFVSLVGIKVARKLKLPLVGTFHTFIADPLYFE